MHQSLEVSDSMVKNAFETYMKELAFGQHVQWRHKVLKSCAPAPSRSHAQQKYAEEKRQARFRDSVLEQHNESQRTLSASRGRVTQAMEELEKTKDQISEAKANYHLRVKSILSPLSLNLRYNNFVVKDHQESRSNLSEYSTSIEEAKQPTPEKTLNVNQTVIKPKKLTPVRRASHSVTPNTNRRLKSIPDNRLP